MKKKDWQKVLNLVQEKSGLYFKILQRLIECFLDSEKIKPVSDDKPLTFFDFADFTQSISLFTLFPENHEDIDISDLIEPLKDCLQAVQECKNPPRFLLSYSKSEPCFFKPHQPNYRLNAKSVLTILTKSDATELKSLFENPQNIKKILDTSDDLFPPLRALLPLEMQVVFYHALYPTTPLSKQWLKFPQNAPPHFTRVQQFIANLHAYEFHIFQAYQEDIHFVYINGLCRKFYRFMLLMDKILEKRDEIDTNTRHMLLVHMIRTLIAEYEQYPHKNKLLESLQTLKTLTHHQIDPMALPKKLR